MLRKQCCFPEPTMCICLLFFRLFFFVVLDGGLATRFSPGYTFIQSIPSWNLSTLSEWGADRGPKEYPQRNIHCPNIWMILVIQFLGEIIPSVLSADTDRRIWLFSQPAVGLYSPASSGIRCCSSSWTCFEMSPIKHNGSLPMRIWWLPIPNPPIYALGS